MLARDFRARAREALKGNWTVAVLTTLVAAILGVFGSGGGSGRGRDAADVASENVPSIQEFFSTPAGRQVLIYLGVIASIASLLILLKFIIGGALTLGYDSFTLKLVDGEPAEFKDLFSRFDMFAKGFVMQLLMAIYIVLWCLLLVIPGIIKAYSYSMTPYILTEHPDMTPKEAITASRALMDGNKWRLFCLQLSFIGWGILNVLTFGIGSLWLRPYMQVSTAAFYRQICAEMQAE